MPSIEHGWATVARETFEHGIVPWAGRPYAAWVRAWSRPHPGDPYGLVQLPTEVYAAFQQRAQGIRLTARQASTLGYPSVPGEQALDKVRRDLKAAMGRGDWDEAHDLDGQLRDLQEQVAAMRLTALKPRALGA